MREREKNHSIMIITTPSPAKASSSCLHHHHRWRRRPCHPHYFARCDGTISSHFHLSIIIIINFLLYLLLPSSSSCTAMAATLSGYAFFDANLDGMRASGWDQLKEYGIPNVSLWLFDCNDMPIRLSETDEVGYYAFENLELGSSYYINAQLPNLFDFGPVWIGNAAAAAVGGEDEVEGGGGVLLLTSPGVDNAVNPATGSTPCFEMTEEEGVVSIGLTLLGSGADENSAFTSQQPTLRPSSATTTTITTSGFGQSISPSILSSMEPEFTSSPLSSPPTNIITMVPTVAPPSTPSSPPLQSPSSFSSSPTTLTLMPSSSSSSTSTTLSPTVPGIQYATPSIPLQMKLNGIDQLEDENAWLSCTAQYIESYFNNAKNDGVYDVMIDLFMDNGNNSSSLFKTRQRQLRGMDTVNQRQRTTKHFVTRRVQSNGETYTEVSYNQQSTYKTANPQTTYDGMYVATIPFVEAVDRGRYIAALWELSSYYKDVASIEPPVMKSQSKTESDNSSVTSSSTPIPTGEEDMSKIDMNGNASVDSSSKNNDSKEGPMLYVIVGVAIVGVALVAMTIGYIVQQRRKKKRHTMDHEYMSTVGNGPALSGSTREVKEDDVAMEDLESEGNGDIDGNDTEIIATAAIASADAATSAIRRTFHTRSSKRSRKTAKSYCVGGRRVNDSSLTPIPENPLSPSSSFSATSAVVLNILAPPGKLGVIVDTPPQGGCAYVVEIRDSCPIREEIHLDDRIIAVDDKDVQRMSATSICKLLERKSKNAQRKITVLREASHFDGLGDSAQNSSLHIPDGPMGGRDSNSDHAQADSLPVCTAQFNATGEEQIEIIAPSGRLGVVLLSPDPPVIGPSYICNISADSPLKEEIMMGDKIIAVDDEDVRDMSAMNVSQLLGCKSSNAARKILVLRQITNFASASGVDQGQNDLLSSTSNSSCTRITIVAPAGKLGIVVASSPGSGLACVSEIKDNSPIRDEIRVGDQILEVDGEDVSKMKEMHISMLIGSKSKNFERVITVLRDGGPLQ